MFLRDLFETDDDHRSALCEAIKIAFARRGTKIVRSYHRPTGPEEGTSAEARRLVKPRRRFVARRVQTPAADRVAHDDDRKVERNPLSLRIQTQNQNERD